VLEVLEDIAVDADLLAALRRLSARGYCIALDDFLYQPHLRPLVELADIIKLDILAVDRSTLAEHVALLRQYDVKLLAEKVETYEEFMCCKALGFEYFQGYFFCRPNVVKGQRSPTNRLALLNVLTKPQSPDVELRDIEGLISRDVSLSYKVLRVANTAYFARARKVESIQQAVALFGMRGITNIVSLLLLSNLDDKPHELLTTALVRANMCERLAQCTQQRNTAAFFTSGLLSVLDAILDRPMPDILAELPLADDLDQALRTQIGVLGTTLRSVLAYERGDWEVLPELGYSRDMLVDAYLEAIAWADEVQNTL
jgi:c-di-GMP phosphodiesterase